MSEPFSNCAGILFDFGGTLDAEGRHWLDRTCQAYDMSGFSIPHGDIKLAFYHAVGICYHSEQVASFSLRQLVDYQVILQFNALGLRNTNKRAEVVERFVAPAELLLSRRVFLLSRLKTRFRLGVVSNFYGNLSVVCRQAGLKGLFRGIVDSTCVGVRKPDPKIFRIGLSLLGLPANKVIFVGDSYEQDMIPGTAVGMRTVWLRGPQHDACRKVPAVTRAIQYLHEMEGLIP